jgi:hypothetical protein
LRAALAFVVVGKHRPLCQDIPTDCHLFLINWGCDHFKWGPSMRSTWEAFSYIEWIFPTFYI